MIKVGAVQVGSIVFDTPSTLDNLVLNQRLGITMEVGARRKALADPSIPTMALTSAFCLNADDRGEPT